MDKEREREKGRTRRPMDLTESFTKRCRAILYFIFEPRPDWTRTLTALVVMLYNAPYASLRLSSVARLDNTRKNGGATGTDHPLDFSR